MTNVSNESQWTWLLKSLSDVSLVELQHQLRQVPEDKEYLEQVLEELSRRSKVKK